MSVSSTNTKEDGNVDSRKCFKNFLVFSKMHHYGRELCFFVAVLFTSYAALHNVPLKLSKCPSPEPFFPHSSVVADFHNGELTAAFQRMAESDICFVMYYAPWDAESQATRHQFKAAAEFYHKQIYFVAINCWQPFSECRQQFPKIQQFPVLIAYTQNSKGVQYKGIRRAPHMIRFLKTLINPLERINKVEDIAVLLSVYDAVVVGFFNFSGIRGSKGYHSFYSSAIKFLERDPNQEVCFAVVTNQIDAARLGVFKTPTIRLFLWNETVEFVNSFSYDPESIAKWVMSNLNQPCTWLSPPGVKSLSLAPYAEEGPVLVVFTPRNPFRRNDYVYDLLREVGLDYYNCNNDVWVNNLTKLLARKRYELKENMTEFKNKCVQYRNKKKINQVPLSVQLSDNFWKNYSCVKNTKHLSFCRSECKNCNHEKCDLECQYNYENCWSSSKGSCTRDLFDGLDHVKFIGRNITRLPHSFYDERSSVNLENHAIEENCRFMEYANKFHHPVYPRKTYHRKSPRYFTGLSCRTNRSLSLLAMDSTFFHYFADSLGVNFLNSSNRKVQVVIFNAVDESSYVMNSDFSKGAVLEFIHNFTEGSLNRTLRSKSENISNQYFHKTDNQCTQSKNETCILEVTGNTFKNIVMDPKKAVLLLYHTSYCAFCHSVSHMLLTVARYFRTVPNLVFARIDGENNDLPWEFTVHYYPTVLFFPSSKKSESRVFPHQFPITVPNLARFVLANLEESETQVHAMIALCASWSEHSDDLTSLNCIIGVRKKILELISESLSQYQLYKTIARSSYKFEKDFSNINTHHNTIFQKKAKVLLLKLQYLKELHLLLGSLKILRENTVEFLIIQKRFLKYQENFIVNTSIL